MIDIENESTTCSLCEPASHVVRMLVVCSCGTLPVDEREVELAMWIGSTHTYTACIYRTKVSAKRLAVPTTGHDNDDDYSCEMVHSFDYETLCV